MAISNDDRFQEVEERTPLPSASSSSAPNRAGDAQPASDDEDDESFYDPHADSLSLAISKAEALKREGNADFAKQKWQAAYGAYREGLGCLPVVKLGKHGKGKRKEELEPETEVGDDTHENRDVGLGQDGEVDGTELQELRTLRSVLHTNVAACCLKMRQWSEAVEQCTAALCDDPAYLKALYRRAQANEEINTWSSLSSALEDYQLISKNPSLPASVKPALIAALRRLPPKVQERREAETAEMMGKLKGLGNQVLGKFGLSTDNFKFTPNESGGYSMNFER